MPMIARKLLPLVVFLLPTVACGRDGQANFVKDMVRLVQHAQPTGKVSAAGEDWQKLRVDFPGEDQDRTVNIGRIWSYCQTASKADCKTAKEEFARKTALRPPEGKLADLRVIVRDQAYYDYVKNLPAPPDGVAPHGRTCPKDRRGPL